MSAGGAATMEFLLELCDAISEYNQKFREPQIFEFHAESFMIFSETYEFGELYEMLP